MKVHNTGHHNSANEVILGLLMDRSKRFETSFSNENIQDNRHYDTGCGLAGVDDF
jgi:hypothetical protein